MSMYVQILSQALAESEGQTVTRDALLDVVMECRTQMLESRAERLGSAETRIAREIAYDRALIALCSEVGIDISPARFADPRTERERLEEELARAGIRLGRPSQQ